MATRGGAEPHVADVDEALDVLGLPEGKRILDLTASEMAAFRRLVGWEPGGPVVAYPTRDEWLCRERREQWKSDRAGRGAAHSCLWMDEEHVACFTRNLDSDGDTQAWWATVLANAEAVAEIPLSVIAGLVPEQGPWTFAGSFCPNCVGDKSPITQHAGFWQWSVLDPDKLTCPYCHITYPHPDYPEEGLLDLPRIGLAYPFHITSEELQSPDWRDGRHASNFAGMPSHVSFVGETRTTKLAWCLGQIEPMSVVYRVTGDGRFAEVVRVLLNRLADVYSSYPVFSYAQEYVDADPAFAIEHLDDLPTPFRRAATFATYTGNYDGRTGGRDMDQSTTSNAHYTNAEWGSSRLGREKASNGQLFLSLFKGYDLIKETIPEGERTRIEKDFLLELYLDTHGLSKRVNNKSGPGAASRVAVGIFYDDQEAIDEGLQQFREIMEGQFYADGSWKETPIYGAKSMNEGLSEIPEMLRGRVDLYSDPLYRKAFETYADLATPLDTQPALGDSTADYRLQPVLVDIARIRLSLRMSYGPESMAGFGVRSPFDIGANSDYTPSLNGITSDGNRAGLDGPIGFGSVGHIARKVSRPSWISLFNEERSAVETIERPAQNRHYLERNLICLGFGEGEKAVQLYCDGGDGRSTHRHQAPLSLLLFADGREVLPDQGYIGDHPANAWIKATAAHNTVVIDEAPALPASHTEVRGFTDDGPLRFVDVATTLPSPSDDSEVSLRRAVALLQKPDGLPILIDVFNIDGGSTHDYTVRANAPQGAFDVPSRAWSDRPPLFEGVAEPGPAGFRTSGSSRDPFICQWGLDPHTWAHVLTPCDEVITFRSPAWRDRVEAFEEPGRAWDALVLRNAATASRYVVVYDVGGKKPWIEHAEMSDSGDRITIKLKTSGGVLTVGISDGVCEIS